MAKGKVSFNGICRGLSKIHFCHQPGLEKSSHRCPLSGCVVDLAIGRFLLQLKSSEMYCDERTFRGTSGFYFIKVYHNCRTIKHNLEILHYCEYFKRFGRVRDCRYAVKFLKWALYEVVKQLIS